MLILLIRSNLIISSLEMTANTIILLAHNNRLVTDVVSILLFSFGAGLVDMELT